MIWSGKLSFVIGEKDKISISSYQGSDFLGLDEAFGLGWTNWVTAVNWSRVKSEKFFLIYKPINSKYKYSVEFDDPETGFEWSNRLSESGLKAIWTALPNSKTQVNWGVHSQYYNFAPIDPSRHQVVLSNRSQPIPKMEFLITYLSVVFMNSRQN